MMPDEKKRAMELRRRARRRRNLNCRRVTVLLTDEDVAAGQFTELTGAPKPFDRQGGIILLSDPDDPKTKIGKYRFLITFLDNQFGCIANGAYTFDNSGDEITFTASCAQLPFFTITGGQGKYSGAEGYVEFMISVERGNNHEIEICSFKRKNMRKQW